MMFDDEDMEVESGDCINCPEQGVISIVCTGSWICPDCYRLLGKVPDEVSDDYMNDTIYSDDPQAEVWRINIEAHLDEVNSRRPPAN